MEPVQWGKAPNPVKEWDPVEVVVAQAVTRDKQRVR